ncbi:hypothetical protein Ami103574_03045 [Aminipila butyrica]|uniref:BIG2 domain-containing protein n=1 Tax=Aminipila butyrica TaxID=433296 RepID=A0A858BSK8_9FIRM|nr:Ig-like domain-containing protein [Aminipila butyrica]QIB68352.1 hypothetical protein Ami103574_03045 [Aminipila butyrica]
MKRFIAILMTLCMVLGVSSVSAWAAETEGWQTKMMMPTSPGSFGTCVIGDRIFVVGGYKSNLVTIYNTKTDTWKMGTPMLKTPYKVETVAIGNNIYAMCNGDVNGDVSKTYMQIYDSQADTWTVKEDIPGFSDRLTVVANGEKLYVTDYDAGKSIMSMQTYDTLSETWTSSKALAALHCYSFGMCVQGDNVYIVGGYGKDGSSSKDTNTLQVYNVTSDTWKSLKKMPTPRRNLTAVAVDNKIYAIGGENTKGTNVVEIYDIEQDSWSTGIPMNTVRYSFAAEIVNGKIYAIGGTGTSGRLNSIEALQVGNSANETFSKLSVLLNTGEIVQLSTSFDLANNQNFTWTSINEAVATVDSNGKVTAVSAGDTDIYAENSDGTFKEYIPVKVVEGIADELRLAVHLKAGEKAKLYLTDDPSQATWSSLDESIATVSADGQVTGVKKGLAIVKAELEGETYQIYVRVNG